MLVERIFGGLWCLMAAAFNTFLFGDNASLASTEKVNIGRITLP